jgi:hypothetical protein
MHTEALVIIFYILQWSRESHDTSLILKHKSLRNKMPVCLLLLEKYLNDCLITTDSKSTSSYCHLLRDMLKECHRKKNQQGNETLQSLKK